MRWCAEVVCGGVGRRSGTSGGSVEKRKGGAGR